ncbi:MAG TPA: energy transducer TonB [Gemmatimonadales bacterium]|nr:energy transducer TonB [Gemmatimonadales bacterium]
MTPARILLLALVLSACRRAAPTTVQLPAAPANPPKAVEPPVAVNARSPVEYPQALYIQGIEGKVVLRLHVDSAGVVDPDSTSVAESSGYPALDSAALSAVPRMKFAPALRNGVPSALTFTQPVIFKHAPRAGGVTP